MKADKALDCKGQFCPMPILNTRNAMKELDQGQVLEVLGTDEGTTRDLPAWCKRTGNELLGVEEKDGVFHFYIRKK